MNKTYTIEDAKFDLVRALRKMADLKENDPDFNGWVLVHLWRTLQNYRKVYEKECFRVR